MSSVIVFANSLDPQNVGPDLVLNCLTLKQFLKEFFEKIDFEKTSADDKNAQVKNRASVGGFSLCSLLESSVKSGNLGHQVNSDSDLVCFIF